MHIFKTATRTWWDGLPGLVIPLSYAEVSFNLAQQANLERVLTKTSHFQVGVLALLKKGSVTEKPTNTFNVLLTNNSPSLQKQE